MKSTTSKNITPANSTHAPFFQKESTNNFFVRSEKPFFNSSPIQAKLTVNQPNDPYEKEADAMADKVLQRLSNKSFSNFENNQIPFFNKPNSIVQQKCTECEKEEKLQKKEKEDDKDLVNDKLQKKPIFESNAEPPEDKLHVQRKCAASEHEDQNKLQTEFNNGSAQSEANGRAGKVLHGFSDNKSGAINKNGPAFQKIPSGFVLPVAALVQTKSATCEHEGRLQKKEEVEEKDLRNDKLQKKPIFECNAEPPEDEKNILREGTECGKGNEKKLQTKSESNTLQTPSPDIESNLSSSKGSNTLLDEHIRTQMENSLGADFSKVHIHTDSSAVQMSKDLNAHAFTHGSDIYFNSGKYNTGSREGQHLLAHELTHVIQQGKTEPTSVQRQADKDPQPKIDKSFYEFIPTATLRVTLGYVFFELSADATFQKGPKLRQSMMIILKKLVGDQFKIEMVKPFETFMIGLQNVERKGNLKGNQDAYLNEPIGTIFLSINAFFKAQKYLENLGLKLQLSDEEKEKIQLGIHTSILWENIIKSYAREGFKPPKWFDKHFFDQLITLHMDELAQFHDLVKKLDQSFDAETKYKADQRFDVIFTLIDRDFNILESTRQETTLQVNPLTQVVYKSIWHLGEKLDLTKPPVSIRSVKTALAFIQFARNHPEYEGNLTLLGAFQKEYEIPEDEVKILPPYPSFIVAPDLNPDNSTVTTAKNYFKMITEFEQVHGTNLVHGVTVAMQMTMYHSWSVFKMPESLKKVKDQGATPSEMVTLSNEFVKNSPQNLGDPVDTYKPEKDRERKISMKGLGTGDFVLMGMAAPTYKKDMNLVQKPSTAGYTFSVFNAADLARTSAYADWDMLTKLKNQLATADPDTKKEIQKEIDRLEKRESQDLVSLTKDDINDTATLLETANRLKKFIEVDSKENRPYYGNKTTDPFTIRLKKADPAAFDVYVMVKQNYPKYSDREGVDKYIEILSKQKEDLGKLQTRTQVAYDSFKPGAPTFRVVAGLVKEDDGNLVPLIMVAGYHPDSEPEKGKYKIKLVDVTFDAPKKKDMIYVGDEVEATDQKSGEREAVDKAFYKFAGYHHYGKGMIVYRLPGTNYAGSVESYTHWTTYLEYAIAALGLVLLVAGVLASGGLLTPAAAAVVAALGIGVGVVGAILSIRNLRERKEKGVLEWDAETSLDIINIIAGAVVAIGGIIKVTQVVSKSVSLLLAIERAKGLYMVYDAVNIASNVYLIHEKVQEDSEAIKRLHLPKHEEDELLGQVKFDAIQQGAMLAVSAYSLGRGAFEHFQTKTAGASYHSWKERGWIAEIDGKLTITDEAPPFLRAKMTLIGAAPPEKEKTPGKGATPGADEHPTTTTGEQKTTTGTAGEPEVPKPVTFQEKITALWKSRLKTKPPMLDTCVNKLRKLNIPEENIINILNNGTNHENPNQFFGDLNVYLIHGEKRVGTTGFNKIVEGLGSTANFESASLLMQNAASSAKANVRPIVDNLSMDDITILRKRMPQQENAETVNNLRKIAEHVDGSKEDVLALLDKAGQGQEGMDKFNRALDRLGEGKFKPDAISDSLDLGVKIEKAIATGGGEMAKTIWGEKAAEEAGQGPLKVAAEHTNKSPGDKAYAHVKGRMDEIAHSILNDGGTDVDPIKWGVARNSIENTDLPTLTKNQIIGEMWTASKVKGYKNQGYEVYREVTIDVLDAKGQKIGEAHMDVVLVRGKEILYKEFKSSETASTSTDQKMAYSRLQEGKTNQLRPRGPRATKAFGGKEFPNFVAKAVDFERPQ